MKLVVLPYKAKSEGAALLASKLGVREYAPTAEFNEKEPCLVINWGRGDYPTWYKRANGWINNPQSVMNAIDKDTALRVMQDAGVPTIEFTKDRRIAEKWLTDGALAVFCRQELQGREGSGIVVARRRDQLVDARLYTKYERKVNEYRVHVMAGQVFYSNIKRKKEDAPRDAEQLVRSGKNGFFLSHMDTLPSRRVQEASIAAVEALGLDFGGVDIGEATDGSVRVYEVNTAPELGANTVAAYCRAFKQNYGHHKNEKNVRIGSVA